MSDHRIVNMALKRGFITMEQLEKARQEARILADHGIDRHLSFILLDLGFLTDEQIAELRNSTSSSNIRALEVNGHVIEGRLGSGGMGDVFKARGPRGEEVAVKIMPAKFAQDEEYLFRFHREVNVMTSLQHPHITGFLDAGDVDGRLFLIMEIIEGPNLKEYIVKNGHMDEDDVLTLIEQMASALHFAQRECGIIHRDIKPANIILGDARDGEHEPFCAKLCDFGLAKLSSNVDDHEEGHLTKSGMAVGTPHYMSPEVATGEKYIDQRADIYGLAATAYHAITGNTMYTGRNSGIIMYQQATSRGTLRHWKEKSVSPGMRALLEDMLAKDLFARIQDWETVLERVQQLRLKTRRHRNADRPKDFGEPGKSDTQAAHGSRRGPAVHKSWPILNLFLGVICVFFFAVGITMLMWMGGERYQETVNPKNFFIGLENVKSDIERQLRAGVPEPEAHLILEPGIYLGPIILDESCSMVKIHAAGPGVRIIPRDGKQDSPLIECRSGVRHIHIHGILLDGAGSTAIRIDANASLTLSAIEIQHTGGSVLDISGSASIRGLHAKHFAAGIQLRPGSQLTMRDSVLAGSGIHFDVDRAHAKMTRCRFHQLGEQPTTSLVSANGGQLSLDTMVLSAPASEVAVNLDGVEQVTFDNVSIDASIIGLRSHASRVTEVSGLTIHAREVGLHWSGPWELTWKWEGQRLQAPQPIQGDAIRGLPVQESGANQELLDKVPQVDGI